MVVYAIAVLGVCDGVFMRDVWFYFIIYYYVVILILLLGVNGLKYMKIYYTSIYLRYRRQKKIKICSNILHTNAIVLSGSNCIKRVIKWKIKKAFDYRTRFIL